MVVALTTLGVPLDLRLSAPTPDGAAELEAAVRRAWDWAVDARASAPSDPAANLDVPLDHDVATTLHHLSTRVTQAAIGQQQGRLWMLHAAALTHPTTGAAVALVAPSGTGKSTAARTLGRTWGYLSDETTGIERSGRMVPHPKPLSIVQPGSPLKDQVGPAAAGLARPADPGSLAAVVMLERDGTPTVDLEPVRTAAAIALLAEQTSYLGRLPRPLSFVAEILERTRGVFVAHYREAADLEPALDVLVTR